MRVDGAPSNQCNGINVDQLSMLNVKSQGIALPAKLFAMLSIRANTTFVEICT